MLKLGLWLGAPPLVTFVASSSSMQWEATLVVFVLAVIALLMGLGPRVNGRNGL